MCAQGTKCKYNYYKICMHIRSKITKLFLKTFKERENIEKRKQNAFKPYEFMFRRTRFNRLFNYLISHILIVQLLQV